MARISLVEQYDNKDVIQQIYMLKTATDGWEERISASEQASNEAYGLASGLDGRMDSLEASQSEVRQTVAQYDARIETVQQTADNAVGRVDDLDRQVTSRIADQEVTALDVASAGTGAYAVTAHKQNGNITSNSFNVSKVTSATIGEGSAQNSIYLQLNLSDGTTVRTNDTVISITGVEEDIHVTSIVLEDAPDAHTIKAIFTYNNGQSISSNTLTYDYPDVASSTVPGLVMGNDSVGGVQVDGQGRMTVVGWDSLATDDELAGEVNTLNTRIDGVVGTATSNGNRITALESAVAGKVDTTVYQSKMTSLDSDISDVNDRVDAVEDELGAEGEAGTVRGDLATVEALTALGVAYDMDSSAVEFRINDSSAVWKNRVFSKDIEGGTVQQDSEDVITGPPLSNVRTEAIDYQYAGYTVSYINSLETDLQDGIDGVDARCDNLSSTVSDHGTMLSAQAEAIQANTTAIAGKQDRLTFDSVPTDGSSNPVTSNGVYNEFLKTVKPKFTEFRGTGATGVTSGNISGTYEYPHSGVVETVSNGYISFGAASITTIPSRLELTLRTDGTWNLYYEYPSATETAPSLYVAMSSISSLSSTNPWSAVMGVGILNSGAQYGVTNSTTASSTDDTMAMTLVWEPSDTQGLMDAIDGKQDKLTAGTGISIQDGVISVNLSNANGVSF